MNMEDKEQLIQLIKDINCEKNNSIIEFVCALFDENKRKKVLIRNEYGLLGNMLDKFKYDLDVEIILELIVLDMNYNGFTEYVRGNIIENINSKWLRVFEFLRTPINIEKLTQIFINDDRVIEFLVEDMNDLILDDTLDLDCYDPIILKDFFEKIDEDTFLSIYPEILNVSDRDIALYLVRYDSWFLQNVSDELKNDRELVLEAIRNNGAVFRYASKELQNDKDVVMLALKNGSSLEYVSKELRNDREVVLQGVSKDEDFEFEYASKELKNDRDVVLKVVGKSPYSLRFASNDLKNDKKIVLKAVKKDGLVLEFASKELKNDKEVALEAVKQNIYALEYVSKELRKDKDIRAIIENS